jgi:hypothetical protein
MPRNTHDHCLSHICTYTYTVCDRGYHRNDFECLLGPVQCYGKYTTFLYCTFLYSFPPSIVSYRNVAYAHETNKCATFL